MLNGFFSSSFTVNNKKFIIEETIREGSFNTVYKVKKPYTSPSFFSPPTSPHKSCSVSYFSSSHAYDSPNLVLKHLKARNLEEIEILKREVRILMASPSHPNIISCIEIEVKSSPLPISPPPTLPQTSTLPPSLLPLPSPSSNCYCSSLQISSPSSICSYCSSKSPSSPSSSFFASQLFSLQNDYKNYIKQQEASEFLILLPYFPYSLSEIITNFNEIPCFCGGSTCSFELKFLNNEKKNYSINKKIRFFDNFFSKNQRNNDINENIDEDNQYFEILSNKIYKYYQHFNHCHVSYSSLNSFSESSTCFFPQENKLTKDYSRSKCLPHSRPFSSPQSLSNVFSPISPSPVPSLLSDSSIIHIILCQILSALDHLHSVLLYRHGNLTPHHIRISSNQLRIVLTDFSAASPIGIRKEKEEMEINRMKTREEKKKENMKNKKSFFSSSFFGSSLTSTSSSSSLAKSSPASPNYNCLPPSISSPISSISSTSSIIFSPPPSSSSSNNFPALFSPHSQRSASFNESPKYDSSYYEEGIIEKKNSIALNISRPFLSPSPEHVKVYSSISYQPPEIIKLTYSTSSLSLNKKTQKDEEDLPSNLSDIFSFGCLMFYLFYSRNPFEDVQLIKEIVKRRDEDIERESQNYDVDEDENKKFNSLSYTQPFYISNQAKFFPGSFVGLCNPIGSDTKEEELKKKEDEKKKQEMILSMMEQKQVSSPINGGNKSGTYDLKSLSEIDLEEKKSSHLLLPEVSSPHSSGPHVATNPTLFFSTITSKLFPLRPNVSSNSSNDKTISTHVASPDSFLQLPPYIGIVNTQYLLEGYASFPYSSFHPCSSCKSSSCSASLLLCGDCSSIFSGNSYDANKTCPISSSQSSNICNASNLDNSCACSNCHGSSIHCSLCSIFLPSYSHIYMEIIARCLSPLAKERPSAKQIQDLLREVEEEEKDDNEIIETNRRIKHVCSFYNKGKEILEEKINEYNKKKNVETKIKGVETEEKQIEAMRKINTLIESERERERESLIESNIRRINDVETVFEEHSEEDEENDDKKKERERESLNLSISPSLSLTISPSEIFKPKASLSSVPMPLSPIPPSSLSSNISYITSINNTTNLNPPSISSGSTPKKSICSTYTKFDNSSTPVSPSYSSRPLPPTPLEKKRRSRVSSGFFSLFFKNEKDEVENNSRYSFSSRPLPNPPSRSLSTSSISSSSSSHFSESIKSWYARPPSYSSSLSRPPSLFPPPSTHLSYSIKKEEEKDIENKNISLKKEKKIEFFFNSPLSLQPLSSTNSLSSHINSLSSDLSSLPNSILSSIPPTSSTVLILSPSTYAMKSFEEDLLNGEDLWKEYKGDDDDDDDDDKDNEVKNEVDHSRIENENEKEKEEGKITSNTLYYESDLSEEIELDEKIQESLNLFLLSKKEREKKRYELEKVKDIENDKIREMEIEKEKRMNYFGSPIGSPLLGYEDEDIDANKNENKSENEDENKTENKSYKKKEKKNNKKRKSSSFIPFTSISRTSPPSPSSPVPYIYLHLPPSPSPQSFNSSPPLPYSPPSVPPLKSKFSYYSSSDSRSFSSNNLFISLFCSGNEDEMKSSSCHFSIGYSENKKIGRLSLTSTSLLIYTKNSTTRHKWVPIYALPISTISQASIKIKSYNKKLKKNSTPLSSLSPLSPLTYSFFASSSPKSPSISSSISSPSASSPRGSSSSPTSKSLFFSCIDSDSITSCISPSTSSIISSETFSSYSSLSSLSSNIYEYCFIISSIFLTKDNEILQVTEENLKEIEENKFLDLHFSFSNSSERDSWINSIKKIIKC